MTKGRVHIGTSGWNYDGWIGQFYPEKIKSSDLLKEYAKSFDSVELNNSHYQLPREKPAQEWYEQSPADFIFACKAHRYITHRTKLQAEEGIGMMLNAFAPLREKLGPILYQLPGAWGLDLERLRHYLGTLPKEHRYTFEFRNPSWLCEPVYDLLRENGVALCIYDYRGYRSPEPVTADFVYIRLHGPNKQAYTGSYDGRTLAAYARKIRQWRDEGKDVYCYFDNDQKACAPMDARRLVEKVVP